MISIVTCSPNEKRLLDFRLNISDTIGVQYELIVIDNSQNKYSIFEAYNKGLSQAKYEFVCFIHEDVAFLDKNWGKSLLISFTNETNCALIGVAGATYKSKAPATWWGNQYNGVDYNCNGVLHGKYNIPTTSLPTSLPDKEVVVIDGVFMAYRKCVGIQFNESLTGFHNYDLSFCIDVKQKGYKIMVTPNIRLFHFSEGKIDNKWVQSAQQFYNLYNMLLPIQVCDVKNETKIEENNYAQYILLAFLLKEKKIAFHFWRIFFEKFPFSSKHFVILKNILLPNH